MPVLLAVREWVYRNELRANNLALQATPARERAATADADRQREVAVGRSRTLRRRARNVPRLHGLVFAPDGSFLAGARHDGRLVLWPAEKAAGAER